jgi:hypothetical protein
MQFALAIACVPLLVAQGDDGLSIASVSCWLYLHTAHDLYGLRQSKLQDSLVIDYVEAEVVMEDLIVAILETSLIVVIS